MMTSIKKGDFSSLAKGYAKYRRSYNQLIVDMAVGATGKDRKDIAAAGAGTGITKLLSERGLRSLTTVEPNDHMRQQGQRYLALRVDLQEVAAHSDHRKTPPAAQEHLA